MTSAAHSSTPHRATAGVLPAPAVRDGLRVLADWTSSLIAGPMQRRSLRRARRKSIAQLRALDDQLLADIGVCRDQIPDLVDLMLCQQGMEARCTLMLRQAQHEDRGGAGAPPLPLAGEGRGEGRAGGSTLTLPSLTRRATPSPAGAGEGLTPLLSAVFAGVGQEAVPRCDPLLQALESGTRRRRMAPWADPDWWEGRRR
jgi:uncharacterized protein YjiS (DUF1127 family)